MSNKITIKQFDDSNNELIAGWTPWQAVYNDSGVSLNVILEDCQPETIKQNISAATEEITALKEDCLAQIEQTATAYTNSLDDIYNCLFPMKVDWSVVLDSGLTFSVTSFKAQTINRATHEYEYTPVEKARLMKKYMDSDEWVQQESWDKVVSGACGTNITDNIEGYKLIVENTSGLTVFDEEKTFYMCAYGASSAEKVSETVFMSLQKVLAKGVRSMPSITTKDGEYIWIIVPSALSINRVVCSGFDVTMEEPQDFEISEAVEGTPFYNGKFKAYRSTNALKAETWKLMLS